MTDFTDDFIVPEDGTDTPQVPKKLADEAAFYTTELGSESPVEQSPSVSMDLEMNGTNVQYEEALSRWNEIQEFTNRQETINIISDPNLDIALKKAVVRDFHDGRLTSGNLRDQYIQQTGSADIAASGEEDLPISLDDRTAQEIFLDMIEENIDLSDEVQKMKTAYGKSLSGSTMGAVAGLTAEVLSPLDLHAVRSANAAADLGISVKGEDIVGDKENFLGINLTGENQGVVVDAINLFREATLGVSSLFDGDFLDIPRNFLFTGSLNKKIADTYEASTPEQKKDMLSKIMKSLDDIPGTDFQKWLVFEEQAELAGSDPLVALAGDVAGFAGLSGAAAFFRNPVKGVKWYTTFEGSGLPSFAVGAKQAPSTVKVVNTTEGISSKADDVIISDEVPTGSGTLNATDSIYVSTSSIETLPVQDTSIVVNDYLAKAGQNYQELKKQTANKIFDQSPEAREKGNVVVRVKASEVEKGKLDKPSEREVRAADILLEGKTEVELRLIAGNLGIDVQDVAVKNLRNTVAQNMASIAKMQERTAKFKEADKKFVKEGDVEVPEATVAKDGSLIMPDDTMYKVMRSNTMTEIPVSMGLDSVLNAVKKGIVESIPSQPTIFDVQSLTRMVRPNVDPNSPAGITSRINPVKASNQALAAVVDTTDNTARHLGTTKADIIADSLLPKLDVSLDETFPNVAKHLRKIDEEFNASIRNRDDVSLNEAANQQAEIDVDKVLRAYREADIGTYNQANSTVHIGRNNAEGIATFGRNNNYGWNTFQGADAARKRLQDIDPTSNTRVVERNGSHWVEVEWNKNFNHIDRWMFNVHSMDSSFLGIDTSAITREAIGGWIFPNSMKGDPNLAKEGFLAELKANRDEAKFFSLIRKEILETPHRKELSKLMNETQESQRWFRPEELGVEFPHLKPKQLESLANSYFSYKRGSDYAYELANKIHRSELEGQNFKGMYDENGDLLAYAKVSDDPPATVYNYNTKTSASPKEGDVVVELREPIRLDDNVYTHGIIPTKAELKKLPGRTLPKVEGWVPRKNKENWYIDATPTSINLNGNKVVDTDTLKRFSKTIGAGSTLKEAQEFAAKLASEFPGKTVRVREAVESLGDTSLTDYNLYKDVTRTSKKRGDRLPTMHGLSRLEDPLEAFANTTRTLTRINAWQGFRESFERSFVEFAKDFLPTKEGLTLFPNDVNGLIRMQGSTPEDIKRFKVAQRLLEQYKEMQYTTTAGDRVWRSVFNTIANKLEGLKFAGQEIAEVTRNLAEKGNLLVRVPKTLASNLFIYLNPPRQWLVQPQQLLELNAISPTYASRSPLEIPAVISAITSRAPHLRGYHGVGKATYLAAKKASGMDGDEFDRIVDAIYNTGLPQAVDLNQMLYGTWSSSRFDIDPSKGTQALDLTANVVSSPGKIGKSLGYTPAEMANNVGSWLYSLDRWKNNNPDLDWNTPENIARITADAWDINHSMIGRAGAMPFQNGALGVLFQFMAVQQKGFMQLLSSKTLTKGEKVKLAGARLALYGGYGIPLGAVGLTYLDQFVGENASEEVVAAYENNKGGLIDALVNTALDVMFADPDTKWEILGDTFTGKLEGRSDIAMSKALTPIPDSVPLLDVLVELTNYTDNNKTNPRFPGPTALSSLGKAVDDIKAIWRADTIDTPEKLALAAYSLAETASLFNNYGKSVMMKRYRDKASKNGTKYGLEVTDAEIIAQRLGVTTREEERMWRIIDLDKQREDHLKAVTDEVFQRFVKMERILGEPEYQVAVNRLNEMLELSVEPEDLEEVKASVEKRIESAIKDGTIKESLYEGIFNINRNLNNSKHKEMMSIIRRSAASNPGDAKIVEMLENASLVEAE